MKILIVEDSTLEMDRILRLVREAAPTAEVTSFTDSIQARNEIQVHGYLPDVAFLDIEMPAPTGTELAAMLSAEHPQVNIIYTTAYTSYMQQALETFVSGYLLKPFSVQDIRRQLDHLRYPVHEKQSGFFAQTAGEFDFFCDGKPVTFSLSRAKEALAYLIDRRGASVTKRELFSILFEDREYSRTKQDHMKKIMKSLRETLEQIGASSLLIHARNSYAIDMTKLSTDMRGGTKRPDQPYMEQYSWADGWRV